MLTAKKWKQLPLISHGEQQEHWEYSKINFPLHGFDPKVPNEGLQNLEEPLIQGLVQNHVKIWSRLDQTSYQIHVTYLIINLQKGKLHTALSSALVLCWLSDAVSSPHCYASPHLFLTEESLGSSSALFPP